MKSTFSYDMKRILNSYMESTNSFYL